MKKQSKKIAPKPVTIALPTARLTFLEFFQNLIFSQKSGSFWLLFLLGFGQISAQDRPAGVFELANISVQGTAEIQVVPDEVCVSLAIETRDPNLSNGKMSNDTRAENCVKYLKQNGVKGADVNAGNISVRPEYAYNPETGLMEDVRFYVVTRTIEFRLSQKEKLDDLLTGLMESGVNYVNEVRFNSTKIREHRDAARRQAAKAAREKAELLAAELGVKVGKPIQISEVVNDYYPPVYTQNVMMGDAAAAVGGNAGLSTGTIPVSATVSVVFLIE
jgi:uncharacterized protein